MELSQGPLLVVGVALLAGVVAVALSILAVGTLRRAIHRLRGGIRDLRRHVMVGDLPADAEPSLRALVLELNHLLADLRSQVRQSEALRSSLQALASGPPDIALIAIDHDWLVTAFSRGAEALTGWGADEITGHHVEALYAPGEWERLLPKLARRSMVEAGVVDTVLLLRRDGGTLSAQVSIGRSGLRGEGPLLMAARDLTRDQELEGRLRDSEERYRLLVEGMSDGVFIAVDDRIAYANPALARLVGESRDALQGRSFRDLLHARDLLRVIELLRHAGEGNEVDGVIECLLTDRSGAPLECRIAWAVLEYRGERAVIGTVSDRGEKARSARTLEASEGRLRAIMASTADGILALGTPPDGTVGVTLANRAFCRLFGLTSEAAPGRSLDDLLSALEQRTADRDRLREFLDAAVAGGEASLEGLEIHTPRRALLVLSAVPVCGDDGAPLGTLVTVRDMTERLESDRAVRGGMEDLSRAKADLEVAYRELAAAQTTLAQRNEQLERLNAELRSLDEMKSNLLANVSHELHTPLVSIKGYTEMIVKRRLGPLTPEQERGLGVALKTIDRLIEMIDNLLSFSRLERGDAQLTLESFPLWQVVDEAIEMVGERIRKRNLSVTTQFESDDLVVRGDRLKIGQVFTNLLTNAVKFNHEGGRITIAGRKGERGFLEVEVSDTGVGFPAAEQEKIFERFYQIDASPRKKYEGTGIGLSIVSDILRLHGCSIRANSEAGKGASFIFTLPVGRAHEASGARPPAGRGQARD